MNGSLTTGKCSFDPLLWALDHPRMRGARQRQELRASACGGDTSYVHDTVDVLSPDSGTTALGSSFGSREHVNARAWESVRVCDEVCSAIVSVDHAPTEMVLTRQCADVSKLKYRVHQRSSGGCL